MTGADGSMAARGLEFDGKVALVTGATSGIGRAVAEVFIEAGASVALIARQAEPLDETRSDLDSRAPGSAHPFAIDIAEAGEIPRLVTAVLERLGRVDYLVNSAGIMGPVPGSSADLTVDDWDEVFAVNVRAPFLLARELMPQWRERGQGGAVVNVGSSAAHRVHAPIAYASSKAALEGFTRVLAGELAPMDVNVNAVAPGLTETTRTIAVFDTSDALVEAVGAGPLANLFKRVSRPSDVASVIAFLCSSRSRQITGQTIHVSAGNVV